MRDLVADLDLADVRSEPGVVDLGTPAARTMLRRGWSEDEEEGGRTFVRSDGPESELGFCVVRPRDIPLSLRGTPYSPPGAPPQWVELAVNGHPVGRIVPDGGEARVVLPGSALRAGSNYLVLRYAWTRSPWETTGGKDEDHRRLAVAWDLLRFETGMEQQGRVRAAGGQLALPFGSRVDSFLMLPEGGKLTFGNVRSRGGRQGELRVLLRPDGGEDRQIASLRKDAGPTTVALGPMGAKPARLSLVAVPDQPGDGGFVLARPAITARLPRQEVQAEPDEKAAAPLRPSSGDRPRNVVLYLVDTLRADHLGCYGYSLPVSPRIDAFARDSILFQHVVAQSSWTRPSTATLLTGLLPWTHGVLGHRDALAPQAVTLAERLRERGYRTAGFVTNPNVARNFGLDQGFETFRLLGERGNAATNVNAQAAKWLDGVQAGDSPFFLYLHTMEPHAPYNPPPAFRQRFAPGVEDRLTRMRILERLENGEVPSTPEMRRDLMALYDAEIAANDAAFGALVDLLVQRGLWDDTVVVFVSDHGEEFLDHGGWEHGKTLHQEMLGVPLIVRVPGLDEGRTVDRQVQQVDVVPTILDLLGLERPDGLEGRSLLRWAADGAEPAPDPAEDTAFSWLDERQLKMAAVTTPEWRYIEERYPLTQRQLYDRQADPGEDHNLARDRRVRAGYFRTLLKAIERLSRESFRIEEAPPDAELRNRLKALGYLR